MGLLGLGLLAASAAWAANAGEPGQAARTPLLAVTEDPLGPQGLAQTLGMDPDFLRGFVGADGFSLLRPGKPLRQRPRIPGQGPIARADWFLYQRAWPLDEIPVGARQRAFEQAEGIPDYRPHHDKASPASPWTLVGPVGFDSNVEPTWGRMSGRVRSLAIDPNNTSRLLLGTATGGVWLSNDSGASWTPLTDNQPSLAIGAVAIDPSNSNVFYAGTGEANGTYYSAGILKSSDGGASWTVLGAQLFNRGAIAGIVVSPQDGNVVLVCARSGKLLNGDDPIGSGVGGIYRSTDGGQSYTLTANAFCTDLAVARDNFNLMYFSAVGVGAQNGLYRSADAGLTWQLVQGVTSGEAVGRRAIGLSRNGSKVVVGGLYSATEIGVQTSTDGGNTWSEPQLTAIPAETGLGEPGYYCESQCDYDNAIGINPFDPNDVYLAGVGLYRATDGSNFVRIGSNNTGGGQLHVDHHFVIFDPNTPGIVYNGNDGGLYRSADGGANWTSIGGSLSTIQSYHISLHPTDPGFFLTGNQDNGTTRRSTSNVWNEVLGGDGGYSAIDRNNPQVLYASTTKLNLSKSINGGASFTGIFSPPDGEPVAFIAPMVMDPSNPAVLYGATNRLHRSSDAGANWQPVTPPLTATESAFITRFAIAASDPSVIYTVGSDGSVARVTAAGFTQINRAPLPGRYATAVAIAPGDANTVYVGYSGFNDGTPATPGHVFRSSDAGANWIDVSANLPDVPVNDLAINPNQANEIYAATDIGVFISLDAGTSWAKMANGLPNVGVASLAVNATTNLLAAATYGRSVWVTPLASSGGGGGPLDEPSVSRVSLPAPNPPNASCPSGFFIATVGDGPGEGLTRGAFGMELLLDEPGTRVLAGGLNFGGLVDAGQVGFAGFNFTNSAGENQRMNVSLRGSPSADANASLPVRVVIRRSLSATSSEVVFEEVRQIQLAEASTASIVVPPGFYVATVALEGANPAQIGGPAEGQFFFELTTSFVDRPGGGFQGGAVVGGYHAEHPFGGVSDFAAFCLATPHTASMRVLSRPSYGPTGALDLRLRIADPQGNTVVVLPEG